MAYALQVSVEELFRPALPDEVEMTTVVAPKALNHNSRKTPDKKDSRPTNREFFNFFDPDQEVDVVVQPSHRERTEQWSRYRKRVTVTHGGGETPRGLAVRGGWSRRADRQSPDRTRSALQMRQSRAVSGSG